MRKLSVAPGLECAGDLGSNTVAEGNLFYERAVGGGGGTN